MAEDDDFWLCDACGDEINPDDLPQDEDVDRFCQLCMTDMEDEQL